MTLEPTHRCFDYAIDFLAKVSREKRDHENWYLCHALCRDSDYNGFVYSHGFVDHDGPPDTSIGAFTVDGKVQYLEFSREQYYQNFGVFDVTRYTVDEAAFLNMASGHGGPWVERYRRQCSSQKAEGPTPQLISQQLTRLLESPLVRVPEVTMT